MTWRTRIIVALALAVSPALAETSLAQTSGAQNSGPQNSGASTQAQARPPAKAPAQPAAPVAGANTSLNQLLAAGYQVRAVNVLSDPVRQEIYKSTTVAPQVMVTLQKGSSVAVCVAAAVNWMNQATVTRENKALCHRD